ncbi:MAG: flagellar basal body rod protein FlgC [Planctomyces sp.]|jgi:flagellar basal-body rod protein FlgC|nr:flagellar basal body rod protein FlgC [Planctomyces sp.]
MFHTLDISTSALIAQRTRMDTIAGNIAHVNTTQNEEGKIEPFQRRLVMMQPTPIGEGTSTGSLGVTSTVEVDTKSPPRIVYEPGHPHANAEGKVSYPNVNIVTEFVNAMEASRAYEANVTTMEVTKEMIQNTFRLLG